jgi:UPF0042 nucleotide-binding protein
MSRELRLIIVSGLSGSGKSVALHVLEDLGYYCIDNLPAALLKSAVHEAHSKQGSAAELLAVGVDARNRPQDLESLPGIVTDLKEQGVRTDIIFIDATDEVLLQRYSESRRRHPLAQQGAELRKAIETEREILTQINDAADLTIDTSTSSIYELADILRERVDRRQHNSLSLLIESFGYKHRIPADADFVFDMRCLPNPYWTIELRGLDIAAFLDRWIPRFEKAHRGYLTIAIGCTGGRHRSVCMAEKLAAVLRAKNDSVLTRHNSLPQLRNHSN